ncbi:MAG: hypothetical protein AB7T08_14165, partial [Hyphomonadaceae bacterium]
MRNWLRTAAWVAPAIALAAGPALADAVRLVITESEEGARIEARWADGREGAPPAMEASAADGVLRLRFAEPVEVDVSGLAAAAPQTVQFAQADDDGQTVRLALRRELSPQVGANGDARVVRLSQAPGEPASLRPPPTPPPAQQQAAPRPAAPAPAQTTQAPSPAPAQTTQAPAAAQARLDYGVTEEYTRLAFRFPGATTVIPMQTGDRLELRFSRAADIDLAEFRAAPPRYVREARLVSREGQNVRIQLTLDPGVRQRHFVDGNRTIVDLLPPTAEQLRAIEAAAAAAAAPPPETPYAPPRAPSALSVVEEANATRINVTFPSPARAAAFRRGENIWLLFESGGRINLTGVQRANPRHADMIPVAAEGMIGLRIPAPPEMQVSARAEGNAWTFTLSARAQPGQAVAPVRRDVALANFGRLVAEFGRAGSVRWLQDPDIGDRIAVALLSGPARGVGARRATLEAAILPSAHGGAVEPRADGVTAAFEQGSLIVSRGQGLITAGAPGAETQTAPTPAEAAAIDEAVAPAPTFAGVRARLDQLNHAAALEGVEEGAPAEARMALARYLVENQFAAEALGALRIAAINQPELEVSAEFRRLRAAANIMMARYAEARTDLSASSLADDPAAALWRGYASALEENWEEARAELERGAGAAENYPPEWRARFALARADAALQLGDLPAASNSARDALGAQGSPGSRLRANLVLARIAAARGEDAAALALFNQLAQSRDEEVAVRAGLEAVRLQRARGTIEARQAADLLEAMRYRWRGDALEMDVVSTLGDVYMEMRRWRDALGVMQTAADRAPQSPAGRRLRADMVQAFERLFLDGEADQLEPIQALGLFYQFADLTPVGPNGDRLVRLLAGRLVHVDLLEQAATLLQHQIDERLQGLARAQVSVDLAAIYLLDGQSERAFQTINLTRTPNLPTALQQERRILEARALIGMNRLDHAVEVVERDQSADAQRVRAEAAWRARDW